MFSEQSAPTRRMQEEKKIPYSVEKINMRCYGDKPDSFLAKVPRGLLPVIELDGKVITESTEIMEALEKTFPEPPMLPVSGTSEYKNVSEPTHLLCAPRSQNSVAHSADRLGFEW